jgi:hypothetical protein
MKITVSRTITITKSISRCFSTCPYFEPCGGPGCMMCEHPDAPTVDGVKGMIISYPACDIGFPDLCPLLTKGSGPKTIQIQADKV